jgi:hypothetical protein
MKKRKENMEKIMIFKRIDKNHYITGTPGAYGDFKTEYHYEPFENADSSLAQKHRDDGPAVIVQHPGGSKEFYWYNKGQLVAHFQIPSDSNVSINPDGKMQNGIQVRKPEIFRGREESITLKEMEEFSNTSQINMLQAQADNINNRIAKLREKSTTNSNNGLSPN